MPRKLVFAGMALAIFTMFAMSQAKAAGNDITVFAAASTTNALTESCKTL